MATIHLIIRAVSRNVHDKCPPKLYILYISYILRSLYFFNHDKQICKFVTLLRTLCALETFRFFSTPIMKWVVNLLSYAVKKRHCSYPQWNLYRAMKIQLITPPRT